MSMSEHLNNDMMTTTIDQSMKKKKCTIKKKN
jgi:hypothetical protein